MFVFIVSRADDYIHIHFINIAIVIHTTIYHLNIYRFISSCLDCASGIPCVHAKLYKYEGVLNDSTQGSDQPWKVRDDVLPLERMK